MVIGITPDLNIFGTALIPSLRLLKGAKRVVLALGRGRSLSMTLVTTAKVPSEPTSNCVKSYPVETFTYFPPVSMISPVGKTASNPNT